MPHSEHALPPLPNLPRFLPHCSLVGVDIIFVPDQPDLCPRHFPLLSTLLGMSHPPKLKIAITKAHGEGRQELEGKADRTVEQLRASDVNEWFSESPHTRGWLGFVYNMTDNSCRARNKTYNPREQTLTHQTIIIAMPENTWVRTDTFLQGRLSIHSWPTLLITLHRISTLTWLNERYASIYSTCHIILIYEIDCSLYNNEVISCRCYMANCITPVIHMWHL